ncbi:MAG: hypothetical protein OXF93_17900 [Acidobacteria bacterium]|nr:hypothetical protein [Acidobacteriota bacterium]
MSRRLLDLTLHRAGWGRGQSLELDVEQTVTARDPDTLPNLLRVRASGPLSDLLSWPSRSGCALQCLYSLSPVGRGPTTLRSAEAVVRSSSAEEVEIELVRGWPGEPHYWGNRSVHEEEVETAIHGLAPDDRLVLLSLPAERADRGGSRARILKSEDDAAVLFIAHSPEEAWVLSGVVDRLCDTGVLVQRTSDEFAPGGSQMAAASFRRTDRKAPFVTRWMGGYGTRCQQAIERREGAPWPAPDRWRGSEKQSPTEPIDSATLHSRQRLP